MRSKKIILHTLLLSTFLTSSFPSHAMPGDLSDGEVGDGENASLSHPQPAAQQQQLPQLNLQQGAEGMELEIARPPQPNAQQMELEIALPPQPSAQQQVVLPAAGRLPRMHTGVWDIIASFLEPLDWHNAGLTCRTLADSFLGHDLSSTKAADLEIWGIPYNPYAPEQETLERTQEISERNQKALKRQQERVERTQKIWRRVFSANHISLLFINTLFKRRQSVSWKRLTFPELCEALESSGADPLNTKVVEKKFNFLSYLYSYLRSLLKKPQDEKVALDILVSECVSLFRQEHTTILLPLFSQDKFWQWLGEQYIKLVTLNLLTLAPLTQTIADQNYYNSYHDFPGHEKDQSLPKRILDALEQKLMYLQ